MLVQCKYIRFLCVKVIPVDISMAKLQQLITVARIGSIARAAPELNISQPALSRSISGVEHSCGFKIFNRRGHGVELTVAGSQFIEQARALLQSMRVFENNIRLFSEGKAGKLSIGMAPLLASQQLADFAAQFLESTEKAELEVLIRPGSNLVDCLKNDMIEMFFFPEGYIEADPEVATEYIGQVDPVMVVRKGHPLLKHSQLMLEDLADYPWASSQVPPLIENTLKPKQLICDNYHILRDTVIQSDLVCICTSSFVSAQIADGSLQPIQVQDFPLPSTQIFAAKLRGRVYSPLALDALQHMRGFLAVD